MAWQEKKPESSRTVGMICRGEQQFTVYTGVPRLCSHAHPITSPDDVAPVAHMTSTDALARHQQAWSELKARKTTEQKRSVSTSIPPPSASREGRRSGSRQTDVSIIADSIEKEPQQGLRLLRNVRTFVIPQHGPGGLTDPV